MHLQGLIQSRLASRQNESKWPAKLYMHLSHNTDDSEGGGGYLLMGPHFHMRLGELIPMPCFPNLDAKSEAFPSLEKNKKQKLSQAT